MEQYEEETDNRRKSGGENPETGTFYKNKVCVLVAQSCLTLCDPMDCSQALVHGIFQARILEWVAISFYRRSSQPRDQTWVSHIAGRLYHLRHEGCSANCVTYVI